MNRAESLPPALRWSVVIVVLASAVALIHGSALRGWWLNDDPQVLLHAVRYTPIQVLFDPAVWRTLSSSNFTPLVTLSFEIDLAAAGLRPSLFYLHQLLAAFTAAVLLFAVVRRWSGDAVALVASLFFLLLPPTVIVVRSLMLRHYMEGLVLALLAVLAWQNALERNRRSLQWAGALAYLAAMLAKEIYAPLPLLFVVQGLLQRQRVGRTAQRIIPYALVAILYIAWRVAMLGSFGGYGGVPDASGLAALFAAVASAVAGPVGTAAVALLAVAAGAVVAVAVVKRPSTTLVLAAGLIVVTFLPLVAVAGSFDPRYAFGPGVALAAGLALAASTAGRRSLPLAAMVVAMAVAVPAATRTAALHAANARAMIAEGRYIWEENAAARPLLAGSTGWYLAGLESLRSYFGRGEAPDYFLSRHALETGAVEPEKVVTVADSSIGPLPSRIVIETELEQARFDPHGRIAVAFEKENDVLAWDVGPAGGRFTFLTYPHYDDYGLPESGWRKLPAAFERQYFRVRRDDPSGSWTLTPPLPLPRNGESTVWSRD